MAYAVGHISGGHFNPAVSVGLGAGEDFQLKNCYPTVFHNVQELLQQQEHFSSSGPEKQLMLSIISKPVLLPPTENLPELLLVWA